MAAPHRQQRGPDSRDSQTSVASSALPAIGRLDARWRSQQQVPLRRLLKKAWEQPSSDDSAALCLYRLQGCTSCDAAQQAQQPQSCRPGGESCSELSASPGAPRSPASAAGVTSCQTCRGRLEGAREGASPVSGEQVNADIRQGGKSGHPTAADADHATARAAREMGRGGSRHGLPGHITRTAQHPPLQRAPV